MRRTVDQDLYIFRMDAFSPDTLPMARLAEYLEHLAFVLGEETHVHFKSVTKGSAKLGMLVDQPAVQRVRGHVNEANSGQGKRSERCRLINDMLRKDNSCATLKRGRDNVISFLGRKANIFPLLGPFTQQISRDGQLVRIGGKDKSAHASLLDAEGAIHNFEVKRELARELAPHLFAGALRLHGTGRFTRSESGEWTSTSLRADRFEELSGETLLETLARLRGLPADTWVDDAINRVRQARDEGDA